MPDPDRESEGRRLGRYQLVEMIGSGSMGTVYRAEDLESRRTVAVKLVKSLVLFDIEKRERFLQGLLRVSELRHPGICPILEIGDEDDDFYVVMPFLDGESLDAWMARGTLSWKEKLDLAIEIGKALGAGHEAGVIHRGLKPANILVLRDGRVVVTDYGMARFTEIDEGGRITGAGKKAELADTIIPLKALGYMSPEQVRGSAIDHRSDIFSFGALIYEMLTGIHPFESRNSLSRMHAILEGLPPPVSSRGTDLPSALDPIIGKALAKKPQERFSDVREMTARLRSVLDDPPAPASMEVRTVDAPRSRRVNMGRYRLLALLIAAVVFLLWWFWRTGALH